MNATDPNVPAQPSSGEIPGLASVGTVNQAPAATPTVKPGEAPRSEPTVSSFLSDWVSRAVGAMARFLDAAFIEQSLTLARKCGHWAMLAGACLTLVYGLYMATKLNQFGPFIVSLAVIVGIAIAQFAATRFLKATDLAIANTPSTLSSMAFLECTGMLALLLAVVMLVAGVAAASQLSSIVPLLPALLFAIMLTYFGAVALHPELINISLANGTAGEEAIGLIGFFAKCAVKTVPLLFCLLAVGGCIGLLGSFFDAGRGVADTVGGIVAFVPMRTNVPYGLAAAAVVVLAGLVPFVAYFGFVVQYLLLELWRAILLVPGKLDLLRKG